MNRKRLSDYGIRVGCMPTGPLDKITDVPGVTVGHATVRDARHHTGVTVIMPCEDNMFAKKLTAASFVLNGFGKTAGLVQVDELGTLETPIALTNTLNVGLVHDALVTVMAERCAADHVAMHSINPVVGECNDSQLNAIVDRPIHEAHVREAIAGACRDFDEGDVGAGAGTVCHGLKGGIGSASRQIEIAGKTYTLGVLVQSNHGCLEELTVCNRRLGEEIIAKRADFSTQEWMDMLLRTEGMEPDALEKKEKLHFLERMVPLVEHNYNLCELGPRGTGKSHLYKEISPYSILMSGGQTTTANLFYSMSARRVGLVGHWDCVAFDEVAGMHFRDQDAIQIMKDYMASGSFARGRDMINADASMVFVGNINDSVQNLLKVTHLFSPFPPEFNNDSAFFDRIHYYLPGWEIPKMRSELLTEKYGLITDCLAEYTRGMRRMDFTHVLDEYFHLNRKFNKRDEIAVRKTMSGLIKLLFPDKNITRDELEWLLKYAIEGRRRVKEQLKIMAGIEFADTDLGYCDDNGNEVIVGVPEQSSETLIPAQKLPAGHVFAIGACQDDGEVAVYRLENKSVRGSGKFETQGIGNNRPLKESVNAAWAYFQSNAKKIVPNAQLTNSDYLLYYNDIQGKSPSTEVSIAEWVALCSALVDKPVTEATAIVGEIKLSGSMGEVHHVEDIIRVAKNAGARRVLLPMQSMADLMQVSGELLSAVQPVFYLDAVDAVRKALDIF